MTLNLSRGRCSAIWMLMALLVLLVSTSAAPTHRLLAQDDDDEPRRLRNNQPVTASFSVLDRSLLAFVIDVPPGARKLHIAAYGSGSDLDVYAHRTAFDDWEEGETDHASETGRVDEELVISAVSTPRLRAGRYYIYVACWTEEVGEVSFTVVAAIDAEPKLPDLDLPPFRPMAQCTPLQRAVDACVSVECDGGAGSGTVLTPDGLILTNAHVLELEEPEVETDEVTGPLQEDDIAIAFTRSVRRAPEQLYLASLVQVDRKLDLALLKVTKDMRGNPFDPQKRPLTWLPLGDPDALDLDDELRIIGFPSVGGERARSSVTLTRGVVSGFEMTSNKLAWIKTDGSISSGNSGGTLVNKAFQLVAVPTMTINEEADKLGFARPVSRIPEHWLKMVRKSLGQE